MAIKIQEHNTEAELKREIRDTTDGRYQLRLNTILLAKKGMGSKLIQKEVLISPNTYYNWVHTYNEKGMEGLKNIKTTGRAEGNPGYEEKIFIEVFKELDEMNEYWSIAKMRKFVKDLHNEDVPEETMRMRVIRAGYSHKSNRPSPYKGDKDKQEAFKKTDLRVWVKS